MRGDSTLLDQARQAGQQLAEAERQTLVARGEYHAAIRRLHLGGAPLREIAEALAISHQRVQQIVHAAGGSWWQLWRARRSTRGAICTWCERPPSEVAKLIAGPAVFICDACVEVADQALRDAGPREGAARAAGAGRRCSFCRKRATGERPVAGGRANVCRECLRICREILDGRAA